MKISALLLATCLVHFTKQKECKKNVDCLVSKDGADYTGTLSKTKSGYTCQRWDSQAPHRHTVGTGLEENYCRNPDGEPTVWCYTTDPGKRWEVCNVQLCGDCSTAGTETATDVCLTTKKEKCVFPFTYGGTYTKCLPYNGKYWCSLTKEWSGKWGYCDQTVCPPTVDVPATTTSTTTATTTTTVKGDCTTVNIQTSTWHNANTAWFYSGQDAVDQDVCLKKCKDFLAAHGTFCVGWSYYKPSQWCYIHDKIDETKFKTFSGFSFARNEKCPSKFPNCAPTVRVDTSHSGDDITSKTTADVEECYQQCKDFEQDAGVVCAGVVFRESDGKCWLMGKVDKCKLYKKEGHLFAKNEPCQTETIKSYEKVTCGDFSCLEEDHTLRKWTGASEECAAKTKFREFTQAGKDSIVKAHNEFRQKVASGNETTGNQPAAANMRKMIWNDELAMTAQRWTDQCIFGHDPNRRMCDGTYAGQNGAGGVHGKTATRDEINAKAGEDYVTMWYNEVKDFDSSNINPFKYGNYGHYSQVMWAESYMVGCGIVTMLKSPDSNWLTSNVMCNYAPGGNYDSNPMYLVGAPCSQCPDGTTCDTTFDALCV